MLNVLIVDDDKLTRKGLIASMPWDKYEMKIVGEAGNGIAALEFLEKHKWTWCSAIWKCRLCQDWNLSKRPRRAIPG